jgi:NADH pyrophosphatase NudC (nudix superfamily)
MKYTYCPVCAGVLSENDIEGRMRLICNSNGCGFTFWNNPTPVVAIVVEMEQGIVIAHNARWPLDNYSVITGFLESNESPESAAIRELKEELGLTAKSVRFIGNFSFPLMNQIVLAYHIHAEGTVQLNEELDDWKFVRKNELLGWDETGEFQVGQWLLKLRILK